MLKNVNMPKIQKIIFFFIFQDMIVWFKVGGNTSFEVILNAIWRVSTPLCKNPLPFCQPHENSHFFWPSQHFSGNFHNFSQHLLTKIFSPSKSPRSPLQNPNFDFFTSLLDPKIFYILDQKPLSWFLRIFEHICLKV